MSPIPLETPHLSQALATTNFFNGRLLTAADLRREQDVRHHGDRRLGRAMGRGVVRGLEVTDAGGSATEPVVSVTDGLAITEHGVTLALPEKVRVSLAHTDDETSIPGHDFVDCAPPEAGTYVAGEGLYALLLAPAVAPRGRAPASGLGNAAADCGQDDRLAAGVRFRLLELHVPTSWLAAPDVLRNRVADRCLRPAGAIAPPAADVFADASATGLGLNELTARAVGCCEVPLAVLRWRGTDGLMFVDTWAVRRRPRPAGAAPAWEGLLGDEASGRAEARSFQFQLHLDELLARVPDPKQVRATDHFTVLPPAGVVPLSASGDPRPGIGADRFFTDITIDGTIRRISGAAVPPLLRTALAHAPVDLTAGGRVRVYDVAENAQAAGARPYLLFTSSFVPDPLVAERVDLLAEKLAQLEVRVIALEGVDEPEEEPPSVTFTDLAPASPQVGDDVRLMFRVNWPGRADDTISLIPLATIGGLGNGEIPVGQLGMENAERKPLTKLPGNAWQVTTDSAANADVAIVSRIPPPPFGLPVGVRVTARLRAVVPDGTQAVSPPFVFEVQP